MTTTRLTLVSTSRATDAGWLAAADIAGVAAATGAPYRLVGGLAVTLLVHALGADGLAPERETADGDMGVPMDVCGDDRLPQALIDAGYQQLQGNRFTRRADDRELVIDVLAPSYQDRMLTNQVHGRLVVDEIPGLATALALDPTIVDVAAALSDGSEVSMTLHLPDVAAALVMKALAYRGRFADRDAIDVHRLLEAARVAGRTAADWPRRIEARDAAHALHQFFGSARAARSAAATAARVRLLVSSLVPADPRTSGDGPTTA